MEPVRRLLGLGACGVGVLSELMPCSLPGSCFVRSYTCVETGRLEGHNAPVLDVVVNDAAQQAISVSTDSVIKVHTIPAPSVALRCVSVAMRCSAGALREHRSGICFGSGAYRRWWTSLGRDCAPTHAS